MSMRTGLWSAVVVVFLCTQVAFGQEINLNYVGTDIIDPLTTLEDGTVKNRQFSESLKIKPAHFVVFWASWCEVCLNLIPKLTKSFKSLENCNVGLKFIAIKDSKTDAEKEMQRIAPGYSVLVDEKGYLKRVLNLRKVPTIILLNSKGIIQEYITGGQAMALPAEIGRQYVKRFCTK